MEFKKYQHVERFGTTEVEGIELGRCYVFPKIDGTNASLWFDNGLKAGSRNRDLSLENDNAGFYNWAVKQNKFIEFFKAFPNLRLYGEWLVPHSLRTYREDAWRNFYVFDVCVDNGEDNSYHSFEEYKLLLDDYKIDYISPIAIITNGSYEQFIKQLEKNVFLIQDGKGVGEGIVIKNYEYKNKFNRIKWAKIVTTEFKEKHSKVMGASEINGKKMIEEEIANTYITNALCEKAYAKIENKYNGFSGRNIPELLSTIFYDLITEESWNFVKKNKFPTINFKTLQHFTNQKIKENLSNLF